MLHTPSRIERRYWTDAILRGDSSPNLPLQGGGAHGLVLFGSLLVAVQCRDLNLPAIALRKVDLDGADCDVAKESLGFWWSDWLCFLNAKSYHVQVPSGAIRCHVARSQPHLLTHGLGQLWSGFSLPYQPRWWCWRTGVIEKEVARALCCLLKFLTKNATVIQLFKRGE